MKIVDLSRELYHRTPSYPGHPPVMHGMWKDHGESLARIPAMSTGCRRCSSRCPTMAARISTRPGISARRGIPIDQYPLEKCIVPGICLDLRHIAPRTEITPADLEAAVKKAGVGVPKGGTVLLCTGHHARTFPRKAYSTDNSGVNVAATEWLAKQGIVHFGIDSMRPGPDSDVNLLGAQGLPRSRHHPHREPVQSRSPARPGPVHLHRAADEMARGHGLADPRGRRVRPAMNGNIKAASSRTAALFPRHATLMSCRRAAA